jgi:hypothetical protein
VVPVVDLISPLTQTIIETGYDRSDYSRPTPGSLLPPLTNPITLATDLVNDVPEGINMALEPGRTPLPGSPPPPTVTTTTTAPADSDPTNTVVTSTTKLASDINPLTRLSMIAKPNGGIVLANGATTDRPSLPSALGDVHPIRDAVTAVSGAVKKVLGQEDKQSTNAPASSKG